MNRVSHNTQLVIFWHEAIQAVNSIALVLTTKPAATKWKCTQKLPQDKQIPSFNNNNKEIYNVHIVQAVRMNRRRGQSPRGRPDGVC